MRHMHTFSSGWLYIHRHLHQVYFWTILAKNTWLDERDVIEGSDVDERLTSSDESVVGIADEVRDEEYESM